MANVAAMRDLCCSGCCGIGCWVDSCGVGVDCFGAGDVPFVCG